MLCSQDFLSTFSKAQGLKSSSFVVLSSPEKCHMIWYLGIQILAVSFRIAGGLEKLGQDMKTFCMFEVRSSLVVCPFTQA